MSYDYLSHAVSAVAAVYAKQIPILIGLALLFSALTVFESQTASPGKVWWRNPGLATDITYALVHAIAAPYFRLPMLTVLFLLLSPVMTAEEVGDFVAHGRGPVSALPFYGQVIFYLLAADFLSYWIHRIFHDGTLLQGSLWRFHAIHHSSEEIDWTSTYRFHPINIVMQSAAVSVLMLASGVSPEVMAFTLPFDILSGAFVHANVNWTLGPLKYVIATPVFHRWHHTYSGEGGNSNFAPTFAFWDWMFGTFYMPEGKLPQVFGVDDRSVPEGYLPQLAYPFRERAGMAVSEPVPAEPQH